MREIKLANSDKVALVDADMWATLSEHSWYLNHSGYATRAFRVDGKYTRVYMHRVIASTPPGKFTDHKNQNRLDNRRENLRVCSPAENSRNSKGNPYRRSRFKGVVSQDGAWVARIRVHNHLAYLGHHKTEEAAARAYDAAAITHFGEFANLNFEKE